MESFGKSFCNFSRQNDLMLIKLVRAHPELYLIKHELHRNTVVRENIWTEIAKDIGRSRT